MEDNKNGDNKNIDKSNKLQRNNSFSKEFIVLNDESEKQNGQICQSSRDLNNNLINIKEKILGKPKEISPTIFDEKIKKQPSSKGLSISLIAGQKEIKNLSNITNALNQNEEIKNNINKDDYLQIRKIPKISKEMFERTKKEIIEYDNLEYIYKDIMKFKWYSINEINYHDNVGCLLPLAALIESRYNNDPSTIEEMSNKYNILKKYIYNYRTIKGDGNCFYRAIIFRYFEIIILNQKVDLLKNIIYDIKKSFNSNEIKSRIRVKYDTILNTNFLKILIIILDLLEDKRISDAHYLYVKSININPLFDYGLIIYYRYIFYNYIKQNENKLYLENFPIKIGNLLPSNYETEKGEFLFNKFYYCYLLSMFTDAEKIIIYLTPFVLGINLDIIVFDDKEDEIIKNVNFTGKSEYNFNNDKMFVLNVAGHYELLYSKSDNIKYQEIFEKYTYNYLTNLLVDEANSIIPLTKTVKNIKSNNNNLNKSKDNNKVNNLIDSMYNYNYGNNTLHIISSSPKTKTTYIDKNNINSRTADKNTSKSPYNNRNNKTGTNIIILSDNKNDKNNNLQKYSNHNYKYKYSNSNDIQKNKNINNIDKDKTKNSNKIVIKPNIKINDYKEQNKNSNNNNRYKTQNNIDDENYFENINEEIDTKQNIKNIINIKSMNLTKKMNEVKYTDTSPNTVNKQKDLSKSINIQNKGIFNFNNVLSKILTSPIKNEENKKEEETKLNVTQCQICSAQYNLKNKNEKISNICHDCLKNEIINQLYPIYLSYIIGIISNIDYELAFKNYFNDFIKNELSICNVNISIENAIKEYYNKENEKALSQQENQEILYFFNNIKSKFCIICLKELSSQQFQIPCGCNFCSIIHIKEYFHLKNKIKNLTNYVCICSYEYTYHDLYNLGLFFLANKLYSLKNDIIDILNNILINQCSFCCLLLESDMKYRIKYEDIEDNTKNNLNLGDFRSLKHYICNSCLMNYNNKEKFFCTLCNKNHIFYPE